MKNLIKAVVIFLWITSTSCFSQGEPNVWYFGYFAGMNFPGGGAPVALTNGMCTTSEGSASISDALGNLLFYTDGIKVWNKNHVIMTNGTGLFGNPSSTQSAVIVKKPGFPNIYYIFTAEAQAMVNGLRYSEVDMTLSGGLGSVTALKNILLKTPSCEKITGVRHCNNIDVWIVSHDFNSNQFSTFLVTSAGVNVVPVTSSAGLTPTGGGGNQSIGQLKASPDGKKLGSAIWDVAVNRFELFDFNNSTGIVSNPILLPQFAASSGAYGVEFSPDGTKFYGTEITPGNIYQWNLCAGTNAAIAASGVFIGNSSNNFNGSLQLGPDKKIYVARLSVPWVGVITNPNALGVACNYVDNGVSLAGKNGSLGLPNFVPYYFKTPPPPFTYTIACLTANFTSPTVGVTSCGTGSNAITAYAWNFGNPAAGASNTATIANPTHIYTGPGVYTVQLVLNYPCGADTLKQVVNITTPSLTILTTSATCSNPGSATVTAVGGTGPYTYTWTPTAQTTSVAVGLGAGIYSVNVKDASGCIQTATTNLGSQNAMSGTITTASVSCNGGTSGTASISISGGSGNYSYTWTPGAQNTNSVTGMAAGFYTVTVNDNNNTCSITNTLQILQPTALVATITPSSFTACTSNSINLSASFVGGTGPYTYTWTGGPSNGNYSVSQTVGGNVTYSVFSTDANNCLANTNVILNFITTPTVSVNNPTICAGQQATLTANGATNYIWTGGVLGATNLVSPLVSGSWTVMGANLTCTSQVVSTILVNPLPVINFANNNVSCFGLSDGVSNSAVTVGTGPFTFTWTSTPVQNAANAIGLPAGNYTCFVTDNFGCSNSSATQITQPPVLTLAINASANSACAGSVINLNGIAAGGTGPYTFTWTAGPTLSAYLVNENIAGNYTYTVSSSDANGCSKAQTVMLTFNPQPTITATSATVCLGQIATLTASGANTYLWMPGNISGNTYTVNGNVATNVSVVGNALGCTGQATAAITVNQIPNAAINNLINKGCVPLCVDLTSANTATNIVNYSWNINNTVINSVNANINYCFKTSGNYTVDLTVVDNNGCINTSGPILINVYPKPIADFNHAPIKPIINIDPDVTFTDASYNATIASWNWYFMNTAQFQSTQQNPTFTYNEPGTYAIALVVKSDKGCLDTIVRTLVVGEDFGIYVPNTFTPNADGNNDIFQPKGFGVVKYELRIFNRWGDELFYTQEFERGWDGIIKGITLKDDVYTWKINATSVFGKHHELNGHVTLMK